MRTRGPRFLRRREETGRHYDDLTVGELLPTRIDIISTEPPRPTRARRTLHTTSRPCSTPASGEIPSEHRRLRTRYPRWTRTRQATAGPGRTPCSNRHPSGRPGRSALGRPDGRGYASPGPAVPRRSPPTGALPAASGGAVAQGAELRASTRYPPSLRPLRAKRSALSTLPSESRS
jgi:hypothetical protein